jgi:MarR family transcriptional regulator, organic hydroperoxide resistance regulator
VHDPTPPSGIQWLNDLIRLEIVLWDRIDARLKAAHSLPLGSFVLLYALGSSHGGGLRVGELAQSLHITVGGASKVVDRMERAGLIRREPDGDDRRASRVVLTPVGGWTLAAASDTCEAAMTTVLNGALGADEQQRLHGLVRRLLAALDDPSPA